MTNPREQRKLFLDLLTSGRIADGSWLEVRAIREGGPPNQSFHTGIDDALAAVERAELEGFNVYVGVSMRVRHRGRKEDAGLVYVLWIDVDQPDLDTAREQVERIGVPPTLIIATGGGLHAYWALAEPADCQNPEVRDRIEAILRGMVAEAEADRAVTDVSHVMRVPGTTNRPSAKKRSLGRGEAPCSIQSFDVSAVDQRQLLLPVQRQLELPVCHRS